jgi:hypothetical protein
LNSDIEAEPKTAGEIEADAETARAAQNPDIGAKKLLVRHATRRAQMAKLKRQRRLISLREAINWLAAFNAQGFRGPIDQDKALSIVAELHDALCNGAFMVDSEQRVMMLADDQPATRFFNENVKAIRPENAKRSKMYDGDPDMLRAVIERLWVPRELLRNLFHRKNWKTEGFFDLPPATNFKPAKPAAQTTEEVFLAWIAEKKGNKTRCGREGDLAHMRKTFPDITEAEVRSLRTNLNPAEWQRSGRPKGKSSLKK